MGGPWLASGLLLVSGLSAAQVEAASTMVPLGGNAYITQSRHKPDGFAGGAAGNQFYLRNDGFFTPSVASHQWFYRQPNGIRPDLDLSRLPQQ